MTAMAKQFDAAHQRDGRMTDTMDGLRKSVEAMGTAAATTTEALKTLHQRGAERESQLAELVKAQGRRYAWLFVITLVCSGIAAAVGTIALLQRI